MSIVNAKDFKFTYPGAEEEALKGVSFDVQQGEVLGIIGPVGAGKTTLCKAIAGFAPRITGGQASGEMCVLGRSYNAADDNAGEDREHPVAMVFEDYAAQLTQLSVLDEVMNPLFNRDLSCEDAKNRACELLHQVGLNPDELESRRVWELSGGQQQRLAIAATLALDPDIIIFDKAIDRLDPRGQEKIRQIIEDLAGQKTLIVVEQDTQLLQEIADRILVVVDGSVIAEGPPEDILRDHDLTCRADVSPPVSLTVARQLGMVEAPLTFQEFRQSLDGNGHQFNARADEDGHRSTTTSPESSMVEVRYVRSSDGSHDADGQTASNGSRFDSPSTDSPSTDSPIVKVEHLTYCYPDGTRALHDVNLDVHRGEIHALLGNSNAGKTSLIFNVAGLLEPTKGKISICGIDTRTKSATELATLVGTVFQNPTDQISERSVREEIGFPLKERQYRRMGLFKKHQCYDDRHIEEQVSRARESVGLQEALLDQDPILLPAGLRRLVTVAEAIAMDPTVVCLDEPSVGLSATSRQKLKDTLWQLRDMGKAILVTENDVDFIAEVADTVTVLAEGCVVLQGTAQDIFAQQNWEQLSDLYIHPPRITQLAQQINVEALTFDDLVAQLSSRR